MLGLALLSTALAYVLYFRILATAGATNLLLVTFLIPVSAIVLGVLVLGERLAASQLAGMALIAAGLAAIDGRLTRCPGLPGPRRRRPPQPVAHGLAQPFGRDRHDRDARGPARRRARAAWRTGCAPPRPGRPPG